MPRGGEEWRKTPLWGTRGAITAIVCMGGGGGASAAGARARKELARIRDKCLEHEGEQDDETSLTWEEALVVYKHLHIGDHGGFPLAAWGQERKALTYLTGVLGRKKADKLLEMWGITKKERDNRPSNITEEEWTALEKMEEDDEPVATGEAPPTEGT